MLLRPIGARERFFYSKFLRVFRAPARVTLASAPKSPKGRRNLLGFGLPAFAGWLARCVRIEPVFGSRFLHQEPSAAIAPVGPRLATRLVLFAASADLVWCITAVLQRGNSEQRSESLNHIPEGYGSPHYFRGCVQLKGYSGRRRPRADGPGRYGRVTHLAS